MTRPSIPSFRRRRLAAVLAVGCAVAACGDTPTGPPEPEGALDAGQAGRWTTASPASVGLDPAALEDFEVAVAAGEAGTLSSTLMLRGGQLVYEHYWGEWTPDDLHTLSSATQAVTSLLVGIARDEGVLGDLDVPVLDLLPAYGAMPWPAGRPELTLEHALTMRTGLAWDELSTDYADARNPTMGLIASPDWVQHVLELPQHAPPGSEFAYNSGASLLLGAVLAVWSGRSAEGYAARHLFGPLEIDEWGWSEGPGGLSNTGWGLRLRPRDMAALGELVLRDGAWKGAQVVPAAWLEASRTRSTLFGDGSGYGYQWWLPEQDGGVQTVVARGYGGQTILVIPPLDMVVVVTAENFGASGWDADRFLALAYRAAGVRPPV